MSDAAKPQLDVDGAGAPPRRNGELVFQEPWEGRAFGLAVALGEQGAYDWEEFRQRLIAVIADADRCAAQAATGAGAESTGRPVRTGGASDAADAPSGVSTGTAAKSEYYTRWLTALRRLLVESKILTPAEIEQRVWEFAAGDRDIVNPGSPT